MCDTASPVLNTRSTAPFVTFTSSSAWLPSTVTTTREASTQRTSCGARYSPRSMVFTVSPLGRAIRLSVFCWPRPCLL